MSTEARAFPKLARRPLGRTGIQVSPLGLAALSVAAARTPLKAGLTPEDVERAFYEHGVNTFFVSWQMASMCEGVRRLVRAGHRDELVLIAESGFPIAFAVRRSFERTLRALETDRLDAWLVGWVRSRWYLTGRIWPLMKRLKAEGRVRAIGFSSHDRKLATALAREFEVDVLMIRYNAAHRGAEREVFEPLGTVRPAVIAYTATRWGMLLEPRPERGFDRAMTASECYRFALSSPAVDMVLCAARTADELREDVAGVLEGPLDPARAAEVRRFGDAVHEAARHGYKWMFQE